MRRGLLEVDPIRDVREQRIAIADRESLAGWRGASVHDQRAGAAMGFGAGAALLDGDEPPGEIEIVRRRPGQLDHIQPFLGVFVARLMVAQRRAEHLELALVPAAY